MSFIGNLFWIVLGGLVSCVLWLISGSLAYWNAVF